MQIKNKIRRKIDLESLKKNFHFISHIDCDYLDKKITDWMKVIEQ